VIGNKVPTLKVFSLVLSAAHSAATKLPSELLSSAGAAQPASTSADEAARAKPPIARVRRDNALMLLLGELIGQETQKRNLHILQNYSFGPKDANICGLQLGNISQYWPKTPLFQHRGPKITGFLCRFKVIS
jgi:hypothetical protein